MKYKKILTISIVVLLIIVGIAIIVGSNKNRRVFFVYKFNKPIKSVIVSKPEKDYSYQIVKIKGTVDDTIIITPCNHCIPVKLSGKVNQKFMNFFNEGKSYMYFDPYKAKKGKVKITHKIRR